jgi:hypothetical protein
MTERDVFIEDFKGLLNRIPDTYSLPQWQFAYRQVIYSMGLKILENFPKDVIGPDPSEPIRAAPNSTTTTTNGAVSARSGGPGGHPSIICKLACVVLDVPP